MGCSIKEILPNHLITKGQHFGLGEIESNFRTK